MRSRSIRVLLVVAMTAALVVVGSPDSEPSAHAAYRVEEVSWERVGSALESRSIEAPFTMVGLSWPDGATPGESWFRIETDGTWSPWRLLHLDDEHGPDTGTAEDERSVPSSDIVWVGSADAVQFRTMVESAGAVVTLIDTSDRTRPLSQRLGQLLTPSLPSAVGIPDQPLVLPRADWDPEGTCVPVVEPDLVQVTHAFVHHTTGTNTYTESEAASRILGICLFHLNSRGWNDIAYNFLIDKFGNIWEGRYGGIDKGVQGAHTQGFNSYSMGVAYIGDHSSSVPTPAAEEAVVELLAWKFGVHNVDPSNAATLISKGSELWEQGVPVSLDPLSGHLDAQATSCPGTACYERLPGYRAEVDALWDQIPFETFTSPLVGDFDGDGEAEGAVFRTTDRVWSVTETDGSVTVWEQSGDVGAFEDHVVGDFDADGKDDIATLADGVWRVSRSLGWRFMASDWGTVDTQLNFSSQLVGDFDGDGTTDVAGFADGGWWVSRSTGSGFETSQWADLGTLTEWSSQVVGDFNDDDRDDVAGFDPSDGTWHVGLSTGTGFVTEQWADFGTPSGWGAQLVGDFDGDGFDDIANYYPGNFTWWVSLSSGSDFTTTLWGTTETSNHLSHLWVQDVDADGDDDVLAFDAYNGFIKRQLSSGSAFEVETLIDTPWRTTLGASYARRTTGSSSWVYFGQEFQWVRIGSLDAEEATAEVAATLPPSALLGSSIEAARAVSGDFTGDGVTDVAHVLDNGEIWVAASSGSGLDMAFEAVPAIDGDWADFVSGDFDGNGIDDLAGFDEATGRWWVFKSNGFALTGTSWAQFGTTSGWTTRVVGDFNGDGRDDIANYHPTLQRWWVSVSLGDRFFTTMWAEFGTGHGWSAQLGGDFNDDGLADIASFHPTLGRWWVSLSTGTGFGTVMWAEHGAGGDWVNAVAGNFDGDALDDVAVFDESTGQWVVSLATGVNERLGGFDSSVFAAFGTKSGWTAAVAGDFDDDGLDDIANYHPALKRWWISRSTGSAFTSQLWAEFGTGSGWGPHLVGDYDGDSAPDIANFHPALGRWWVSVSQGDSFVTTKWAEIGPTTPF
ncbi:MAG: VCBS repeat-containing protein [Acidimicrobiia bacterium]|nr:VCBS repeat-containing protein [Acidimicrobiia bacterium]